MSSFSDRADDFLARTLEAAMIGSSPPTPVSASTSNTEVTTFRDAWDRKWYAYSNMPWSLYMEDSIVEYTWVEVQDRYGPLTFVIHEIVIHEEP